MSVDPSKFHDIQSLTMAKDFLLFDDIEKTRFELTNKYFRDRPGLLMFYSPLCPHCHILAPAFKDLSSQLNGHMAFGTVNTDSMIEGNKILADYFDITGVPAIKFYDKGNFLDYEGGSDINELLEFVGKQIGISQVYAKKRPIEV